MDEIVVVEEGGPSSDEEFGSEDLTIVNSPAFDAFFEAEEVFTRKRKVQKVKKSQGSLIGNVFKSISTKRLAWDPNYNEESKTKILSDLIYRLYKINASTADANDLLFYYAAELEIDKLKRIIKKNVYVNQTKNENTVLNFLVKYASYSQENFFECVEILVNAGVNFNRCDLEGKTPLDYITNYYLQEDDEDRRQLLVQISELLLSHGASRDLEDTEYVLKQMGFDLSTYHVSIDGPTKFFWLVVNKKFKQIERIKNITQFVNGYEDRTLVQIFSRSSDNSADIVKFLLRKGASPNIISRFSHETPLELAYSRGNAQIFQELLRYPGTQIDKRLFRSILRLPTKRRILREFLKSPKIETDFKSDTRDTPLHYAVKYRFGEVIELYISRGASLLTANAKMETCLDLIDRDFLKNSFDKCVHFDYFTDFFADYEIQFNFSSLYDGENNPELDVVHKISKNPKLENLLLHPFVHAFIGLKWQHSTKYFWLIFFSQFLLYALLFCTFYSCSTVPGMYFVSTVLVFLNLAFKLIVSLQAICLDLQKKLTTTSALAFRPTFFHNVVEFLIVTLTLLTVLAADTCNRQFLPFIFLLMSLSVLLTAGYHPNLSKWSFMLQTIFKKFFVFLLVFSLFLLVFTGAFQTISTHKQSFFLSLYKNYVSIINGRLQLDDIVGIKGYIFSVIFGLVTLTITSFWLGVALSNIARTERKSEIHSLIQAVAFMRFVDVFYLKAESVIKSLKFLPNPLLFSTIRDCKVACYVNRKTQFKKEGFPARLDEESIRKVRDLYFIRNRESDGEKSLEKDLRRIELGYEKSAKGIERDLSRVRSDQKGLLERLERSVEDVKRKLEHVEESSEGHSEETG